MHIDAARWPCALYHPLYEVYEVERASPFLTVKATPYWPYWLYWLLWAMPVVRRLHVGYMSVAHPLRYRHVRKMIGTGGDTWHSGASFHWLVLLSLTSQRQSQLK